MPKDKSKVWSYFKQAAVDGYKKKTYVCKFCESKYTKNATRLTQHIQRCIKCPKDIQYSFLNTQLTNDIQSEY